MLVGRCLEKYVNKLLRNTEMEDALKRLDRLTQEEARMAAAENLKLTHTVDKRVEGIADTVITIDNRLAGVDDRVAGVDDRQQQTANDVVEIKRLSSLNLTSAACRALPILSGNQLRESVHKWLFPPDPSTNHNIACGTHHKKTATWFFEGNIFREWKSTGSLLWVHGKRLPGPLSDFDSL